MSIPFVKMHGLGNDFVVLNGVHRSINPHELAIAKLANRHLGIGFDQLLIIEPSQQADFFCRIFNADGSEAEQCGNGLRCVARFLHEEKLHARTSMTIATKAGIFPLSFTDYEHIQVELAHPFVEQKLIELVIGSANIHRLKASLLSFGNPHIILSVDSLNDANINKQVAAITSLPQFANGINIGFMQIINRQSIQLRTIERGVGETLACGSNACAAAFAGNINGWLDKKINVQFRHGILTIQLTKNSLQMSGPATRSYIGFF